MRKIILFIGIIIVTSTSWATIDSYQRVAIPREASLQDPADYNYSTFNTQANHMKKFCIERAIAWDPISTAVIIRLNAVHSPYMIPVLNTNTTTDLNIISRPDLVFVYTASSIDNYNQQVHEPSLTIDASGMPNSTLDDRLETITHIKLALIAITDTLYSPYRATINIIGLPSQSGISRPGFTSLVASPNWAYSASSPLIANYKNELLSANCQ